jgi:hypothetical protein
MPSQQATLSMRDRPLQRWGRREWTIFLGSQGATIREIVECLGLSHTATDRGDPNFAEVELQRLSIEVQELSQSLPTHLDALLGSASDPNALNGQLDKLLNDYGPAIWGENADRNRLLIPAGNSKSNYPTELFFEVPMDREL